MKKIISIIFLIALLSGCVSGPPNLTADQERQLLTIQVFRSGEPQERSYVFLREVDAADCSSGDMPERFYGLEENSIDTIKRKAVAIGADAVIDADCRHAPFVNNCWSAAVCSGKAVVWK